MDYILHTKRGEWNFYWFSYFNGITNIESDTMMYLLHYDFKIENKSTFHN